MGCGVGVLKQSEDVVTATGCGPEDELEMRATGSKLGLHEETHQPPGCVTELGRGKDVAQRLMELESLVSGQASRLREMEKALQTAYRDSPRTVSVLQYNILASYLGKNVQPWFLYGAEIPSEVRGQIFKRFAAKAEDGSQLYTWPAYVEGLLTPEQIAAVERQDEFFRWETRSLKLLQTIRESDADVISLVELDHHPFFATHLEDEWDSLFRKRPRKESADGCGIFWRRSKFQLVASKAFDMVDGNDARGHEKRDRTCLLVLLRWRNASQHSSPLVVVSTHLAKDPYNRAQTAIRVRQVAQIMSSLTEFTEFHKALDAPVILLGDLNARHLGEIRGIARTVWQMKGSPIHKFLWGATDVNTGATSITKARQCRIDVVQYLSSHMEVLEVVPVPKLPAGEVIPNAEHPSDHFPVCARFAVKETYQKHRESARAWLECVAGQEKVHPLTDMELKDAFEWLDRDKSNCIHQHDLEEACLDLQCHFNAEVQQSLLDCFPDKQISYEDFLRAYEVRLSSERLRCAGDLECAFRYFAGDSNLVELGALEAAFREITPISFSDSEVKEMISLVNVSGYHNGKEAVNLRDFCDVVCRATFPNREVSVFETSKRGRLSTKEISDRLTSFHDESPQRRSSFGLQPSFIRGRPDLGAIQIPVNNFVRQTSDSSLPTIHSEPTSPLLVEKANYNVQGPLQLLEAELQGKLPLVESNLWSHRSPTKD